jgi:genome maintenance exonuclease 1
MFNYCPPKVLEELSAETTQYGRKYLLPDGSKVPSITTVLSYFKKDIIQEWRNRVGEVEANRISKQASNRGTNVHTLCEKYLNNETNYARGAFPDALEMFKSIRPKLDENVTDIYYQEQALWSTHLGVAGRCDLIGHWDKVLSVVDFKTSRKPKVKEYITDYFMQGTAYALMHEELTGIPIHQIVILIAVENDEPQVFVEYTENWIEPLVNCIMDYKKNF